MLLQNGNNIKQATVIENKPYFVINTYPFNSVIQILSMAAIDNSQYFTSIESNTNKTMQFIFKFIKKGPCADIYKKKKT